MQVTETGIDFMIYSEFVDNLLDRFFVAGIRRKVSLIKVGARI